VIDDAPDDLDEWREMGIEEERDFVDRVVKNLYFGCEADDRTTAFAFSPANYFGAELKPMLSSDIGHWDVMDMLEVLPDSYSLVEKGLVTPEQFRAFTYENPALLHLRVNPNFFQGTRIEAEAAKLLAR
jgi:hypothetical protein